MRHTVLLLALLMNFNTFADDFTDAYAAYSRGDYTTAAELLQKPAEQGHANAQYNLGLMHVKGLGVDQDHKKAVHWFTKAAEQGYADAQYNLGLMHAKGNGIPQDHKKAFLWFTKSAEQGHAGAQNNLGVMYVKGNGVTQDYVKAHMFWNIASANGSKNAKTNSDDVEEMMTPEQIAEAQKLTSEWMEKHSQ